MIVDDCGRGQTLLNGLWEASQSEGNLEELLVEKPWRLKRLLVAEGAEIQTSTEFLTWDQSAQEQKEAKEIKSSSSLEYNGGLMQRISNPDVLEHCMRLLVSLRQGLETDGFHQEQDISILEKIYGEHDEDRCGECLWDGYLTWLITAEASEEERKNAGYAAPEQCKQHVLHNIDDEIRHLRS